MSRAVKSMARLAQVRKDMALAKSRRLAAEIAKNEKLRGQVLDFVAEYGNQALEIASQGVSVSQLRDTYAFRSRLLDGAREQELGLSAMSRQLQTANLAALAAKRKSEGFDRLLQRRAKEAAQKQLNAESREIEDRVGGMQSPGHFGAGTKDA